MDVVTTLKAQHRMLAEIVERLGGHVAHGDAARVRLTLEELRRTLKAHVELEEARFYPLLADAPVAESEMRALLQDLDALAERHAPGELDLERFAAEWSTFAQALPAHLEAEETELFPLFVRVVGKQGLWRRPADVPPVTRGAA